MRFSHFVIALVMAQIGACLADEFRPKIIKNREGKYGSYDIQAFSNSTTLIKCLDSRIFISKNSGQSWDKSKNFKVNKVLVDPFHSSDRAFALSYDKKLKIYVTNDMGISWNTTSLRKPRGVSFEDCQVQSHPLSKDYLIVRCTVDHSWKRFMFVSEDGGKAFEKVESLQGDKVVCEFGISSPKSSLMEDEKTIYCLNPSPNSMISGETRDHSHSQLSYTVDFGKTFREVEEFRNTTIESIQILNSYFVVFTRGGVYDDYTSLWVSSDGLTFERACLPIQATTSSGIFEDSMGRIVISINTGKGRKESSQVYISDSQGLKFSPVPWTLGNTRGTLEIEELQYLPGTFLARFAGHTTKKRKLNMKTKISFDGGFTWNYLKVVDDPENEKNYSCNISDVENCSLHFFNAFPFQLSAASGLMVRLGVVGDVIRSKETDVFRFISRDGGKTWGKLSNFDTSLLAFGDHGNIIVACPSRAGEDGDPQTKLFYSLDYGQTWSEYQFEKPIIPLKLFSTTPDSSGANFILQGFERDTEKYSLYAIDFNEAFEGKKCVDQDYEYFYISDGNCINGVKRKYSRRQASSSCLIHKPFVDLVWEERVCEQCSANDYECSFEFTRKADGECELDYQLLSLSDACNYSPRATLELQPMRLIKGTKCQQELEIASVKVTCGSEKHYSEVTVVENEFDSRIVFYQYFNTIGCETVVVRTTRKECYISDDSGQTFDKFDMDDRIYEVVFNPYFDSYAYFFDTSGPVYYTPDKGYSLYKIKVPMATVLGIPLVFHPIREEAYIHYAEIDFGVNRPDYATVAYFTEIGYPAAMELKDAIQCDFIGARLKYSHHKEQIICQVKEKNSQTGSLVSSNDYFGNKTVLFEKILWYISTDEFTIVAIPHDNGDIRLYVTINGYEFAEAKFPLDATTQKQEAFTILASQAGSIFLHLSTSNESGREFGVLLKSNFNGATFVTLEKNVNRNENGVVDFEKVQGLEGIILVNIVVNHDDVLVEGAQKKLQSRITFNDGSDWSYIKPPRKDSEGQSYGCDSKYLDACALHLHSYSERTDNKGTFTAGSALGILFGVGNVGSHLLPEYECSTFLSSDGGESWREVKKGAFQWEYGDYGSLLVLIPKNMPTNTLTYSLDTGETWKNFRFTEEKIIVHDIVTAPGNSALRFLLLSHSTSIEGGSTKTFSIDFSGSYKKQCSGDPAHGDLDYVTLSKSGTKCLFGHISKYLRKVNNECYVGNLPVSNYVRITSNCACTRNDYECDYNFEPSVDRHCQLVGGLSPRDPSDICKKYDAREYFEPTGYKKIPLSTCEGGLILDKISEPTPCPSKKVEDNESNKTQGLLGSYKTQCLLFIFFVIVTSLGWFVYLRGIRRNGGFVRFGEIRLEDDVLIENNLTDKAVNMVVKAGLYLVSALLVGYQFIKRSVANASKIGERFRRRRVPTYSSLLRQRFANSADDLPEGYDDACDQANFVEGEGNFTRDENTVDDGAAVTHQPYSDEVHSGTNADDDHKGQNRHFS